MFDFSTFGSATLTLTHTLLCLSTQEKFNHVNIMEARAKYGVYRAMSWVEMNYA